ncbi:MAG: transglutaminase domain-containing protein [Calditrichota bacterium]
MMMLISFLRFRLFLFISIIFTLTSTPASAGKYDQVDRHVENIPAFTDKDLPRLTNYLVSPFDRQEDKVRAIYYWIVTNIDYDIVAYRSRSESATRPEEILKQRKCVCGGYAYLFKKMAELAGLEAQLIPGYSKGYNYQMGKLFDEDNMHAWNAVRIDGQWRLLDATWGAGYIDENQKFVRSVNDYYFLTPPEQFIQSHYPKDIPWQLLDRKVSRAEFEAMVYVKPAFFTYALETESHNKYHIESEQSLQVTLTGPSEVLLAAQLIHGDNKLDQELTFVQKKGNRFEINALFPHSASYILRLYAKRKNESGQYRWVMDYQVEARTHGHQILGFPEIFSDFIEHQAYLYKPLDRRLSNGKRVNFKINVNGAEQVALIHNDQFTFLIKNGDYFEGQVTIQPGDQFLAAQFPGSKYFQYLLRYVGW